MPLADTADKKSFLYIKMPSWTRFALALCILYVILQLFLILTNQDSVKEAVIQTSHDAIEFVQWSKEASVLLSLIAIVASGVIAGEIAASLGHAPMLGMLTMGCIIKNVFYTWLTPIPHEWTRVLWSIALSSVLARAGISIDHSTLTTYASWTLLIGLVPVLSECLFLVVGSSIMFRLPIAWAFTVAFGVATISPGVVVPLILSFTDSTHWKGHRVPPIMMAALGIDVLVGTTGFGVALSSAVGHQHKATSGDNDSFDIHDTWYARVIEEMLAGVFLGVLLSGFVLSLTLICRNMPSNVMGLFDSSADLAISNPKSKQSNGPSDHLPTLTIVTSTELHGVKTKKTSNISLRAIHWLSYIFIAVSCVVMTVGKSQGLTGAASCAIIIMWSSLSNLWPTNDTDIPDHKLRLMWGLFKPLLFPVIGSLISFRDLPLLMFMKCFALVFLSVLWKYRSCYAVCGMIGFRDDEQEFVSGLWTGKASVQATLCSVALEVVHAKQKAAGAIQNGTSIGKDEEYAYTVFCAMVSAILIGIPFASGFAKSLRHLSELKTSFNSPLMSEVKASHIVHKPTESQE